MSAAVPEYAMVRLAPGVRLAYAAGRELRRAGAYGNLHAIPVRSAVRLVDDGLAMLLPHQSLARLRAAVEAQRREWRATCSA